MTVITAIALDLATAEMPVFPCRADKRPAIPKAEGGRGFHDASLNPAEIRRLFNRPNAVLVGTPTGSRFDVLDVDPRHGGDVWEAANRHRLPETRIHQTPGGGRHWLFAHAHGVTNTAGRVAPGIDVRGVGGYVIMPPSAGYRVISDAQIAHWPDWLLALVLPPPASEIPPNLGGSWFRPTSSDAPEQLDRVVQNAIARVRSAAEGQKHFQLRNAALLLGGIQDRSGFSDGEAIHWLLDALPASVRDWKAATETASWGLAQGRCRPLELSSRDATAPDPRRRETAARAFRLMRSGTPSGAILARLHAENRRRPVPLPPAVIDETAIWAARRLRESTADAA